MLNTYEVHYHANATVGTTKKIHLIVTNDNEDDLIMRIRLIELKASYNGMVYLHKNGVASAGTTPVLISLSADAPTPDVTSYGDPTIDTNGDDICHFGLKTVNPPWIRNYGDKTGLFLKKDESFGVGFMADAGGVNSSLHCSIVFDVG